MCLSKLTSSCMCLAHACSGMHKCMHMHAHAADTSKRAAAKKLSPPSSNPPKHTHTHTYNQSPPLSLPLPPDTAFALDSARSPVHSMLPFTPHKLPSSQTTPHPTQHPPATSTQSGTCTHTGHTHRTHTHPRARAHACMHAHVHPNGHMRACTHTQHSQATHTYTSYTRARLSRAPTHAPMHARTHAHMHAPTHAHMHAPTHDTRTKPCTHLVDQLLRLLLCRLIVKRILGAPHHLPQQAQHTRPCETHMAYTD